MIEPATTAAILLAAGASRRFGSDKLGASVGKGTVLGLSAKALAASGCVLRAAVVSEATKSHTRALQTLGFETVLNGHAVDGLSTSIRVGVNWAQIKGAQSALLALADMPFVDPAHYLRLFRKAQASDGQIAFTSCGDRRLPPAIFGAVWFARLQDLQGDAGARALLASVDADAGLHAPADALLDIDTLDDLIRNRSR